MKKSPQKKTATVRNKKTSASRRRRSRQLTSKDGIQVAFFTGIFIFAGTLAALVLFSTHSPQPVPETSGSQLVLVPKASPEIPPEQPSQPAAPSSVRQSPAAPVEQPPQSAVPPPARQPPQSAPPPPARQSPAAPVEQPPQSAVPPPARQPPAAPVEQPPQPAAAPPARQPPIAPVEQPSQPALPPSARQPPAAPVEQPSQPVAPPPARQPPAARVEQPPQPTPEHQGTLVFVIDDAGNNLRELEPFLRFPGPLTIAVLPGLPHSSEAARRIRAAGKEVFLHQPMEALGGQNPGPGAVYLGMSPQEVRAVIERNLDEIGPVKGMNNHQGSRITMDEGIMETVLSLCRERGLIFLDSRTIADTAAPQVARRLGMSIGERDVFLDNEQERKAMIRSVSQGLEKAAVKGSAVMIGHTWSPELAPVLTELYPNLIGQGYSLATASQLIKDGARQ